MQLSKTLSLPDDLAGRRTAVFGISGSGKSNSATVVIEELIAAGEQVILIDPKGEGWGLLSKADGKPSNLDLIIFGEPHGHIEQLTEAHGKELADFAAESGRSIVLSLLGFNSDQSERRFVASFLQQLYRRKSRQERPTRALVVIEEAHLFVPEGKGQGFKGEMADLVGAVQRVARQGRSAGLGTLIIDQRPQDVAKRVISQCDTIVCHQLTHKLDRDALADWVRSFDTKGQGEEFLNSLSSLKPGEAWVWSPSAGIFNRGQVRRRKTFDSGSAPDASISDKPVQRAKVDLDSLRSQLATLVEKAKADDPAELKKRIRELEKQLAAKPAAAVDNDAMDRHAAACVVERDKFWREKYQPVLQQLRELGMKIAEVSGDRIDQFLPPATGRFLPSAKRIVQTAHRSPSKQPVSNGRKPAAEKQNLPTGDLPKGERVILTAVAQHPGGCDRAQLTILTGYKRSSRDTYIQRLREKGFLESGDPIVPSQAGIDALGDFEPLPTGSELLDHWLNNLPEGERKILEVVSDGQDWDRDSISEVTDYKRSSRDTYIQRLKARKLVDTGSFGVRASDMLFD